MNALRLVAVPFTVNSSGCGKFYSTFIYGIPFDYKYRPYTSEGFGPNGVQ